MSPVPAKLSPDSAFDPRIDVYINQTRPFAQPILHHLRELVHQACPKVQETIKWSRPFFEYNGLILANMSAFNEHCSFGFWGDEIGAILRQANVVQDGAMGSLGRITTVKDLPSNKQMLTWLKQAVDFIDSGNHTSVIAARKNKVVKAPAPKFEAPPEFSTALRANKNASKVFNNFSPSAQYEYIEWIAEAKRPETRDKRITQSIEWLTEGKQRNWKYQNC
jgi:uncharacterized protein YdeI (YjbR/CyaY-like superfamily)